MPNHLFFQCEKALLFLDYSRDAFIHKRGSIKISPLKSSVTELHEPSNDDGWRCIAIL
jgi:hypothetical protein